VGQTFRLRHAEQLKTGIGGKRLLVAASARAPWRRPDQKRFFFFFFFFFLLFLFFFWEAAISSVRGTAAACRTQENRVHCAPRPCPTRAWSGRPRTAFSSCLRGLGRRGEELGLIVLDPGIARPDRSSCGGTCARSRAFAGCFPVAPLAGPKGRHLRRPSTVGRGSTLVVTPAVHERKGMLVAV